MARVASPLAKIRNQRAQRVCAPFVFATFVRYHPGGHLHEAAAAREKATAEHAPLTELERASAEYTEAVSARTKAEAAEDAAEAKLEAVLRGLEGGHAKAE